MLTFAAYEMRQAMVKQSMLNTSPVNNSSGKSAGWFGDFFKLGGGRVDEGSSIAAPSPLGGAQGGRGLVGAPEWRPLGFRMGYYYEPGSFTDLLVEAYAGPHDWISSWNYTANGNFRPLQGLPNALFWTYSLAAIVPATVFAAAPVVSSSTLLDWRRISR
jgi:filamentous hemagglutinin